MLNGTHLLVVKGREAPDELSPLAPGGALRREMQWFQLEGSPSSSGAGIGWTQQSGCRREKAKATSAWPGITVVSYAITIL